MARGKEKKVANEHVNASPASLGEAGKDRLGHWRSNAQNFKVNKHIITLFSWKFVYMLQSFNELMLLFATGRCTLFCKHKSLMQQELLQFERCIY